MSVRHPFSFLLAIWLVAGMTAANPPQHPQRTTEAEQSFNLALKLEQAGNTEQAVAIYTRLVEEFPGNLRYYQRLKHVLRNTARYGELLQVIDEHLTLYPQDIQSQVELGDIQLALGRKERALQAWEGILQRFPGNMMAERLVLTHLFTNNLMDEGHAVLERLREAKNDPSFFALDMGRLYAARLSYDSATDEFLRHISTQPQTVTNVTNQLLRFPTEPEIMTMLREKLSQSESPQALRILASVEFKHRNFPQAVELYQQLGSQPKELLDLGLDLLAEGEWNLTQRLMEQILADPEAVALYEQAIMTLARIYEARSTVQEVNLPLSGFYQGNRFFTLPFIRVDEAHISSLRQAMTLYDSLTTTWRNPRARLRLADIKYLVLDDFDGALTDFQSVITNRSARQYYPQASLRLVDVWIAKGDLEEAEQARRRAETQLKTRDHLNLVEIKAVELLFLSGDSDSLLAHVGGLLATLGPNDLHFNDLMELSGLVRRFDGWPEQYAAFVQSERLLRQNRRSEAIAMLAATLEEDFTAVSPILQYRLALLEVLQGNYSQAEELTLTITGETEFTELGLLTAAELADHLKDDAALASTRYLAFLDTYPLSIYSDAVRLRYRTLNPEED
ncbi:MAG: tetratricopeptide repeat protein [Fidelibacterota bacterium]|nr:MAG: tetratricopeptide repeat protein [Candidatus Neomarinimicrobiota bacterium]